MAAESNGPVVDWRPIVRRHADGAGVDLPQTTVDEMALHLDDLYAAARAEGPISARSTCVGTCRQPTSRWCCCAMISSTARLHLARSFSSFGKNAMPAANCPGGGNSCPSSLRTTRCKNSCGSAVRIHSGGAFFVLVGLPARPEDACG